MPARNPVSAGAGGSSIKQAHERQRWLVLFITRIDLRPGRI
jgi:hypothetical protein